MPAEYLLRHRLGVNFREKIEEMEDREPISLNALDRFEAGELILTEKLQGASPEDIYPVLKGMGNFPLGTPGRCTFEDLDHEAGLLADDIQTAFGKEDILPPVSAEVVLEGFRVSGTIDRLTRAGRMIYTFGQLTEGRKTELWMTHLFMNNVSGLPCPAASMMIGRGGKGPRRCRFDALPNASDLLQDLLKVYRLGLTIPLPLFPKASCAYARAFLDAGEKAPERKVIAAILRNFLSASPEHPGECQHPAVRRLFGNRNPLADCGETGFAALSVRVFGPMLQVEGDGKETPEKGGAS
jgi:exodeoxyribonuclease V gamma subunit